MLRVDGIKTPELEVSDTEFEEAGGLVRVIGGNIVLGKTAAEQEAEAAENRKSEINSELAEIDARSGRAARAVALAVSTGQSPLQADTDRLTALEAEAEALRAELQNLQA
jgi:hypothetical protein